MARLAATRRLAAAVERRAGFAGRVLARALCLARPVVKPGHFRSTPWREHPSLVLAERRTACGGSTVIHRLVWLEDGRLVEAWHTKSARRASWVSARKAAAHFPLPAILLRLPQHLARVPGPLQRLLDEVAAALEDGAESLRRAAS